MARSAGRLIRTPLLLPSFSSKGFPRIGDILALTQEVLDAELLVSAYDVHYGHVPTSLEFAQALFLDSGGYEAGQYIDLSDPVGHAQQSKSWSPAQYQEVVTGWRSSRPTVIVSYDEPGERLSFDDQLRRARETLPVREGVMWELLLKPSKEGEVLVDVDQLAERAGELAQFDAIGITEKEIGTTVLQRMVNIGRIRRALERTAQASKPIHIFGSLDPISSPLYFFAGADIFDGLTWLRFAYQDGVTIYRQNFAAHRFGIELEPDVLDASCWFHNYRYLKGLEREMVTFTRTGEFSSFGQNCELFRRCNQLMLEGLGV
jgi:hypothetical protein